MIDKWGHVGEDVIIGYDGENNAREIKFGISKWLAAWPGTTPRIVIEREIPKEKDGKTEMIPDSYIAVSRMNGETIIWEIKGFDLEYPGYATMWIAFVSPDGEKTRGLTPPTQVQILEGPDMIDGETPPEKVPPWMAQVIAAANRIDKTAEEIPGIIETALQEAKGSGEFDGPAGTDGAPGKDGFTPTLSLERVEDGVQVKATNKDGEQVETVFDGTRDVFVARSRTTADEIRAAVKAGKVCIAIGADGAVYTYDGETKNSATGEIEPAFRRSPIRDGSTDTLTERWIYFSARGMQTHTGRDRKIVNPYPLTINGAVYDGSRTVNLTIEGGGGGTGLPAPGGPNLQLVTDADGNWVQAERLAWAEGARYDILPETDVIIMQPEDSLGTIGVAPTQAVEVGKTYVVTYNGVPYTCVAQTYEEVGVSATALGNLGAMSGMSPTAEPFIIICVPPEFVAMEGYYFIVFMLHEVTPDTKVSVRIEFNDEIVKPIDPKYFGTLRGQKTITLAPDTENDRFIADVSFETAWAMDEAELQNAIRIDGNEGAYASGMSVCAVSKVTAGNMRAIQMLCMSFDDYNSHKWSVLQWFGGNNQTVAVYSSNALMPMNRGTEDAVPVIWGNGSSAGAIPMSTFKHLLGVASLNVQITKNDDGSYSSSHQSGTIHGQYMDGVQIKATLIGGFAPLTLKPLYIGETCVFSGVSYTDDGADGMITQAVLVTITGDDVRVEIVDLAERERVKDLEQGLVTLSEEIAALPEQIKQDVIESLTKFDVEGDFVTFTPKEGAPIHVVTNYSGYSASNAGRYLQHVTSKNLYNFVERLGGVGTVIEKGGLTATVNADHTLTVVGTNSTNAYVSVLNITNDAPFNRYVFPAGTYTVAAGTGFTLQCASPDSVTSYGNKTGTFTIDAPFIIRGVVLNYAPGKEVNATIPLAMVRGTAMPDNYEYVGKVYAFGIPSGYPEGTIDWTTGELYDAEGDLVGTYPAPTITGFSGENTMWIGAGTVHAEGDTTDLSIGGGSTTEGFDPAAWGLPVLYLNGSTTAMTKDTAVDLSYSFGTRKGTCSVKWQGSSSLQWAKKNYTVKFDTAFEAKEGWGEENKYCIKANYIDHSHARNLVNAMLWGQIVKSRDTVPSELADLINGGAVDGFPILIVMNGEFLGLYTFNIPKDGWMMGMGNGTNEAILCANQNGSAPNFKGEATLTNDLEIEYITDEDNTAWAVASVNNLINACINSDGTDLDTTIATMLDWQSAIDYYIFTVLICGHDMMTKNYLLSTFDGTKWCFGAYDLDCTHGLTSDGMSFLPANHYPDFNRFANTHRVMELIKLYKTDELKARYAALRETVLSESNIATLFANFAGQIPKPVYMQEAKRWPLIPNTSTNDISQIRDYYRMRVALADKWIEELQ